LIEAAHWTRIRWEFSDEACGQVWKFNSLLILLAGVLVYLDGNPYRALPNLLTWLPPLLLPMQFVQDFGMSRSLPLNTFSFLAKQRRLRNLRLGLTETIVHIHFGNVYFVATLIAATLGNRADGESFWFLPCIIVLTGWMLLSTSRTRPLALVAALAFAGAIAVAGQFALISLDDWVGNRGTTRSRFDPRSVSTMIGRTGTVDLSPEIIWRLRSQNHIVPPKLLRTGSYNFYRTGIWSVQPSKDKEFNEFSSRIFQGIPYTILTTDPDEDTQLSSTSPKLPRFTLRGAAFEETPLPLPGDVASLHDFELDGIEGNDFGTIRIFPKQSIIEGTVLWKSTTNPETPPTAEDLAVPSQETQTARGLLASLRIGKEDPEIPLPQKLEILRGWFQENFVYSRSLTIAPSSHVSSNPSAITQFLTTVRSGHCEYFASAAVLMLREAGIPARYAVGYSVVELDRRNQEYILRGTHGHAWCRVWDKRSARWIDFDATPTVWIGGATPPATFAQRFSDSLKRIREDFFLWRNQPGNRIAASVVMISIGLAVAAFVAQRLWKSRRRIESAARIPGYEGPLVRTPLHDLEISARKKLGHRPMGKPFGEWLADLRPALADPEQLDEAIALHQRLRFDPDPEEEPRRDRLAELASRLEKEIRRTS
jgi:protein-glutamine gamma-glutamyltransferase